jgi:hypothetical protein
MLFPAESPLFFLPAFFLFPNRRVISVNSRETPEKRQKTQNGSSGITKLRDSRRCDLV